MVSRQDLRLVIVVVVLSWRRESQHSLTDNVYFCSSFSLQGVYVAVEVKEPVTD